MGLRSGARAAMLAALPEISVGRTELDNPASAPHIGGVRNPSIRPERMPALLLLVYASAATGGIIGYTPLLTLLLPIKLQAVADADRYALLAQCSVAGALAAGVANITFGWLGDRSVARGGGRRRWLVAGLIATAASFATIAIANGAFAIVAAVVAFQIAINALLAQVSALIAEEVPAAQKNTTAALLTLGNPVAAAASALVVAAAASEASRLALVTVMMSGCVAPLLFARPARVAAAPVVARVDTRRALVVAWAARLLVQIANSGVSLLLFFYLEHLIGERGDTPGMVSRLLLLATLVPVPLALLLGRWTDRIGRRETFLAGTALLATLGLVGMALADRWTPAALCYLAFATGVTIFQALNIGHAMLLLPDQTRPGRKLGFLNLANTLPQVIAPLLAWAMTARDFTAAFGVFALLTLAAAVLPFVAGGGGGGRTVKSIRRARTRSSSCG